MDHSHKLCTTFVRWKPKSVNIPNNIRNIPKNIRIYIHMNAYVLIVNYMKEVEKKKPCVYASYANFHTFIL